MKNKIICLDLKQNVQLHTLSHITHTHTVLKRMNKKIYYLQMVENWKER